MKGIDHGGGESLSARRSRLIRDEVSAIAMNLFIARGFDAVSVDEIAAAANMSQRTFFRYFATKDEVVLQYERHLRERLHQAVRRRPTGEGPVTALKSAFLETSAASPPHRDSARQRGRVLKDAPLLSGRVRAELASADGELARMLAERMPTILSPRTRQARSRVIVSALLAVAGDAWEEWVVSDSRRDPATYIRAAFTLLEQGWDILDETSGIEGNDVAR